MFFYSFFLFCNFYNQGNVKCVKLLLSKGANWKVKDNKGRWVTSSEQSLNNSDHISF